MEIATEWVRSWMQQEGNAFTGFTEFVATRLTGAVNTAIAEWQKRQLAAGKSARLEVPWGVFDASVKTVGEGTNITPTYEPTNRFLNALNGDETDTESELQGNLNTEYIKLVQDWLAYGYFDADDRPDLPAKEKGARIDSTEIEYFLHSMMRLMVSLAKDHQRDGKDHKIHFVEEFDFGEYSFTYKGDEILPKFVASKAYKQMLKNDSVAETGGKVIDFPGNDAVMAAAAMCNYLADLYSPSYSDHEDRDDQGFCILKRRAA